MAAVSPILIASPTRCGTTCLAWLLHLHGVWIGKGRVTSNPETNPQVPTENVEIKQYLKSLSGNPRDFRERVGAMVHTDGPWLVKNVPTLTKWKVWNHHYPEARWLLPYRPVADCLKSKGRQVGRKMTESHRATIVQQFEVQDDIAKTVKHSHRVSANWLCMGYESEARKAVEFCGLEFDSDIYHEWVNPERWSGK